MFVVAFGVTLVLNNITLKGHSSNNRPLVAVGEEGILIMNTGSKITNNKNNIGDFGAGVCVDEGTFIMNDGTISENIATSSGAGVWVEGGGIFTMNGGTISGNTATWGGGGVYVLKGDFIMKGGTISGNTSSSLGGGVFGAITKTGGIIYGKGEGVNSNTANSDGKGHAVYGGGKYRDTTAGPGINLSTANNDNWNQ